MKKRRRLAQSAARSKSATLRSRKMLMCSLHQTASIIDWQWSSKAHTKRATEYTFSRLSVVCCCSQERSTKQTEVVHSSITDAIFQGKFFPCSSLSPPAASFQFSHSRVNQLPALLKSLFNLLSVCHCSQSFDLKVLL